MRGRGGQEEQHWHYMRPFFEPLLPYIEADGTEEVCVTSGGEVFRHHHGGIEQVDVYMPPDNVHALMRYLSSHLFQGLSEKEPLITGTLPYVGWRFSGQLPPVVKQPCFALRVPARSVIPLSHLIERGNISESRAAFLKDALLKNRMNVLVGGATGSGKTTAINSLMGEVVSSLQSVEKILVMEDTQEISISYPYVENFLTTEWTSMRQLVKHSLRQTPHRIVLGEVRDGEMVLDLLSILTSGHGGSISTIHASSARDIPYRLQELVSTEGKQAPMSLIVRAVQVYVYMRKKKVEEVLVAKYVPDTREVQFERID